MSIFTDSGEFHLKISRGDIGRYVILPGDPGRVEKIAEHLENAHFVAQNREYCIYSGSLCGEAVSVCSTGIGGPSAAIAVEELVHCGADTFIRVGTSGGMATKVVAGDLCIASAAVRGEGTSYEYIPRDYPAAADFDVVLALNQAAEKMSEDKDGMRYHIGVVQSKDSFYGETNPETMPVAEYLRQRWGEYLKCGCLTSEMECAAIFSAAIARGVRAGGVLTAIWNVERQNSGFDEKPCMSSERAIKCAVEAIKILIKNDTKRG